ncbi:MAG: HTH domain-containing protein, partial [Oscillospiraceae bacterium]
MHAEGRRQAICRNLEQSRQPISATALAGQFGVSRQVIVGDIALLRASGAKITATPRGYVILGEDSCPVRQIACQHDGAQIREELYAIVDQGCTVLDVTVE